METVQLNNLNPIFTIKGSNSRRSLRLTGVKLLNPVNQEVHLQVRLLDEKDMPVFSQDLTFNHQQVELPVQAELVFYGHMSVALNRLDASPTFEAEVYYA